MSWFPVLLSRGESPGSSVSGAPDAAADDCADGPADADAVASSGVRGGTLTDEVDEPPPEQATAPHTTTAGTPHPTHHHRPHRRPDEPEDDAEPPTVPGKVTAESLSDPDSDHFVVSVPEGLDQTQREVVVAYVAHDRATWRAYRAMDGDHSAVETTTGSDALAKFQDNYAAWAAQGLHAGGVYRVTIQTVDVGEASSNTAVVFTCVDQHDTDLVKADGTSSTTTCTWRRWTGRRGPGSWCPTRTWTWGWTSAEGRVPGRARRPAARRCSMGDSTERTGLRAHTHIPPRVSGTGGNNYRRDTVYHQSDEDASGPETGDNRRHDGRILSRTDLLGDDGTGVERW